MSYIHTCSSSRSSSSTNNSEQWLEVDVCHVCMFTAPKITDLTVTSCIVDWTPLKPLGSDSLAYVLQLQCISSRDLDYHEASSNCYTLDLLTPVIRLL